MGSKDYWNFGMSEYAVRAYTSGIVPASKIKGVPASLVKQFCSPKETHLTSKNFNKTDFYSPWEVRSLFGLEKNKRIKPDPRAVEALDHWKESRKNPAHEVFDSCVVQWTEYLGRTHWPQAITHKERGARVEVDGQMATVVLKDGKKMRKRLSSKGFKFWVEKNPEHTQLSLIKQS